MTRHALRGRLARGLLSLWAFVVWLPTGAAAQAQPDCSTVRKNLWIRDTLNDWYLWYQFVPPVDPVSYDSPEAYLEAVRHRPIDQSYSYVTSRAASEALFTNSQFVGLGLSTRVVGREMLVLQVFEASPAAEAGLNRGSRVLEIDGRSVASLIDRDQIDGAFGPAEEGVEVDVVFETRDGSRRSARLVKRVVTIPTVSHTRVLDVDGRRVGYIFFRNFVGTSNAALDDAFATLRAGRASELVLDLRYNGGGLVSVAQHLASLIAGPLTNGQVLGRYVHNDKRSDRNRELRFENPEQPMGLSRLVVVTTRASASASELIVNGLRPYIPVTVVGQRTYGKPVGQYLFEQCDKAFAPVSFSIRNALDEGDYFDGIPANCDAADDVARELGDPAEPSLAEALHVVRTGTCSAPPTAGHQPSRAPEAPRRVTGWQSVLNAW